MWGRKSARIADLEAWQDAAEKSADRRVEEAAGEVRSVACAQYADLADRHERLQRHADALARQVAAQYRAVDFVTGMDTPEMRADLEEAGQKWRTYLATRGRVTCQVKRGAL